jgi:hypothetical protein
MKYEDSYSKAFPFGKLIDGMLDPRMIEDTVQLIREALRRERRIAIIINNRAGGNAPLIEQLILLRYVKNEKPILSTTSVFKQN